MQYAMPTAPLVHTEEALCGLLACAEAGIPLVYSAAPMLGGTGPVTLTGSLLVANAEMLSGLVIHQLCAPGAPFLHGPIVGPLQMRTMVNLYCGPQSLLGFAAAAQLSRYYHLPAFSLAGASDAKVFDQQASAEAAMTLLSCALAGATLIHDVGYLESGLCASPEQLVWANEIIAQVRVILRGLEVSEESMLIADIAEVGPGGSFLNQESTLTRYRQEIWHGDLSDQDIYENWQQAGAQDTGTRVRARLRQLLAEHTPLPLDEAVHAAVWNIARDSSSGE
jgi:trimethylamine--corrinoid protein Co-methyltransferase